VLLEEGLEAGFQVIQQVHGYSPSRFLCSAGMKKYNSRSFGCVPFGLFAQDDNSAGERPFTSFRVTIQ
jgi:hypothetical protein